MRRRVKKREFKADSNLPTPLYGMLGIQTPPVIMLDGKKGMHSVCSDMNAVM
jgi:hypothetical protein